MQVSFEELGTALVDATFAVLDLETTGLSPTRDRITEIGVVKVRGGEVLGEFQCLVHPGVAIPAAVTAVTGITDRLVRERPRIEYVLPTLLEFLAGPLWSPTTRTSTSASSGRRAASTATTRPPHRSSTPRGSRGGCSTGRRSATSGWRRWPKTCGRP